MEETGFFNSSQEIGWKLEQDQELLRWWLLFRFSLFHARVSLFCIPEEEAGRRDS